MGQIQPHRPVMLIAAISSRHDVAFDWAFEQMQHRWGDTCLQSERFDFVETDFYQATMGEDLKKQFVVFKDLIAPEEIAQIKVDTNGLEQNFTDANSHPEQRPLNIDPGYLTEAKLVLATTKDRDHRLYINHGIYAEVTLHYHHKNWKSSRWTYPDYQREDFQRFFTECRDLLRQRYRNS